MPLNFNPIGINITLPVDGHLVVPYIHNAAGFALLQTLRSRIDLLDTVDPQFYNMLAINAADRRAVPNTPAQPSYITINGLRYDVVSYIGGGSYGSIYSVSTVGDAQIPASEYIMKLQIIDTGDDERDNTEEMETINEALINYILCTRFPARCNAILKCVAMLFDGQPCYCFILEKLNQNLGEVINHIGVTPGERPQGPPTQEDIDQGNMLAPVLCGIATGLEEIYNTFNGNHGDLKPDNIMDGKLIDYGFFRLEYEGVMLVAEPTYNAHSRDSRDLTNLIYVIWHYCGGHRCGIRNILRTFLNIPNPAPAVFIQFDRWSLRGALPLAPGPPGPPAPVVIGPINRMRIAPNAPASHQAMRLSPPIELAPMYRFFNHYNAVATFAAVKARLCPGPVPIVMNGGLRKKSRRTRRNVKLRKNKNKSRNNKNKHRKL